MELGMIPKGGKFSLHPGVCLLLKRFASDRSGATMVEYGLLVAMISAAIMGTLLSISEEIKTDFTYISENLGKAK